MRRMLPANLFTDEYPSRERYWTVFIEYCSMNVHFELQSLNDLWAEEFNPIQNLDQCKRFELVGRPFGGALCEEPHQTEV